MEFPKPISKLTFLRHAEKAWTNVDAVRQRYQTGHEPFDPPITADAWKVARNVAVCAQFAVCSPFLRCVQTAAAVGIKTAAFDKRIGEYLGNVEKMGGSVGGATASICEAENPAAEKWSDFCKRVDVAVADFLLLREPAIIITHGAVVERAWLLLTGTCRKFGHLDGFTVSQTSRPRLLPSVSSRTKFRRQPSPAD